MLLVVTGASAKNEAMAERVYAMESRVLTMAYSVGRLMMGVVIKRFTTRNDPFTCEQCGRAVPAGTRGVMRNHCPFCLYGKHVDDNPGDRQATCGGLMPPVHAFYQAKQIVLVHRCLRCGIERRNRAAMPPCNAPDDLDVILALMRKVAMEKG